MMLAVGALTNCTDKGPDIDFTTQGDDQVMSVVTGVWSGTSSEGKTYTLTLCEDDNAEVPGSEKCQELYTVVGGGRGQTQTINEPQGCGGCDFGLNAFTSGTFEGDDVAPTAISVAFSAASGDANGPVYPMDMTTAGTADLYGLALVSSDEIDIEKVFYFGTPSVQDAGAEISSDPDAGATPPALATKLVLRRTGNGQCPSQ